MISPALRRFAWLVLSVGLVSAALAARAPNDPQDVMRFLEPLWGKSIADFPKAAKLHPEDYKLADALAPGSDKKLILLGDRAKARLTPKSLAQSILSLEFDPKLGLVEVSGFLKGTAADF